MMSKKITAWALVGMCLLVASGCATGRTYQTDVDGLNSRIASLQGELAQKDQEIARMQNQMVQQQAALRQAESDKRMLGDKLDMTLSQLESQSKKSATKTTSAYSDLK